MAVVKKFVAVVRGTALKGSVFVVLVVFVVFLEVDNRSIGPGAPFSRPQAS